MTISGCTIEYCEYCVDFLKFILKDEKTMESSFNEKSIGIFDNLYKKIITYM
jgi:hypothetical protein